MNTHLFKDLLTILLTLLGVILTAIAAYYTKKSYDKQNNNNKSNSYNFEQQNRFFAKENKQEINFNSGRKDDE